MTTGFSLVLYSRLHLLKPSVMTLRVVLACIIIDAFLFHSPTFIITSVADVHLTPLLYKVYKVVSFMEVAFSVQEVVIAALYIYLFVQFTKDSMREPGTKAALRLLIVAECMVVSTDIVLCILLYMKLYLPRVMIQSWVVVAKLQIEFVILNSLQKFSQRHANSFELGAWERHEGDLETPGFITTPPSDINVVGPTLGVTLDQKKM
jgi:hypothetical protein